MSVQSTSLSIAPAAFSRPVQFNAAAGRQGGLRGLIGRLLGGIQDLAEGELPEAEDDRRNRRERDDEDGRGRRRERDRDGLDFD